ncbi:hypothetical protein ABER23_04495 [Paenibacillus lautus]|uniref:hypothetical protein n=1 Tax=Paenibacillus lautus TaxID=1401 RepID=UPI003D2C24E6
MKSQVRYRFFGGVFHFYQNPLPSSYTDRPNRSDNDRSNNQQQQDGAVNANSVAGNVSVPESLMKQGGYKMNYIIIYQSVQDR